MRRLVGVLSLLAGCDFTFNLDHLKDPPPPDATDAEIVYMDAPGCFGLYGPGKTGLAEVCLDQAPPDTWTPSDVHTGMLLNPGDCMIVQPQGGTNTDLCVIFARNITIGGYLPTSGNRPLVLVATDTFTLLPDSTISADSRRNAGRKGAGSNEAACPQTPKGTDSTAGASGGAGGSFGGKGGNGGKGAGSPATTANAALVGLRAVRGGCKGGDGGSGSGGAATGDGGTSGGAVYVIAGKRIDIQGTIDASGEAGNGGLKAASTISGADGGGGGGSGGLIGLDSPSIMIAPTAILVANGGGGGGGGGNSAGSSGAAGMEALLSSPPNFPAPGGMGGSNGGLGGTGANGAAPATAGMGNGAGNSAGGGGGGGAGFIQFFAPSAAAIDNQSVNVSPPAS